MQLGLPGSRQYIEGGTGDVCIFPSGSFASVELLHILPGSPRLGAAWFLHRARAMVARVNDLGPSLEQLSQARLRERFASLRYRAAAGEPLGRLLPECYATVREAARRALSMRHYDVQVLGGVLVYLGAVAEMETGEGKTLTATLPLCLYALSGRGAHLATANDYLAGRDAQWMRPLYHLLGLDVQAVLAETPPPRRRAAYDADITYGTIKEFGFDFLRDRLAARAHHGAMFVPQEAEPTSQRLPGQVQRGHHFLLVDEADSLLIDEARTPLVISQMDPETVQRREAAFRWAAEVAGRFAEEEHYDYDPKKRQVTLTLAGRALVRQLPKPSELDQIGYLELYEMIERAIYVARELHRDQHYVVRGEEVVIIDEFTGRPGEGRRWSRGVHEAVEAKEGLPIHLGGEHAAQVTVQEYASLYEHLAGMTGTAWASAREFQSVYGLQVVPVPTHRPCRRVRLPDRVLGTAQARWEAVVDEVAQMHEQGRPVLVGTRSIDKSEQLSALLTRRGIEHQVLNARHLAREAEIVAGAGQPGRVTVATNMAGRGTDIALGPGVAELGGLHVIVSELHESARIDRQLAGRCARQGDPGTFRCFMALDDEVLLRGLGPRAYRRLVALGRSKPEGPWDHLAPVFYKAQRRVQRQHYRQRRVLLYQANQRKKMQLQMGLDPYLDTPES